MNAIKCTGGFLVDSPGWSGKVSYFNWKAYHALPTDKELFNAKLEMQAAYRESERIERQNRLRRREQAKAEMPRRRAKVS